MKVRLDRRTVLRGLGGVAVGLPVLECMLNSNGDALAQATPLPKRYAVVFAGQALGGDDWADNTSIVLGKRSTDTNAFIVPPEAGAGYTVTTPLKPLADLKLMGDFSLVSGMRIPWSATSVEPTAVPPSGAFRDFHGGGAGPLLCGTSSQSASFTCRSATSDQIVAGFNQGTGSIASLVVRAQPAWYLSGSSFSGRQYISYKGGNMPVEAQTSPSIVYHSLFDGFVPTDMSGIAQHDFDLRARKSLLSLITDKRQKVTGMVGANDKIRLERHFDELRDLEMRIAAMGPMAGGQCKQPMVPGADPAVGGDNAGAGSDKIATNTGYSDEAGRARLLADLIYMAFVCDITRVATLQITVFQSHMNVFPISDALGVPIHADQHECGHNGDAMTRGQIPVSTLLQWHISHYAYLLDKLKNSPEGAGNVLDNSSIVFMPEAGHGVQLNDSMSANATHSVDRMILLVAGHAGGLKPGKHIATNQAHPGQVLVSAMQAVGYTKDTFGEVTGKIAELFT
jgi:hypothetical protein